MSTPQPATENDRITAEQAAAEVGVTLPTFYRAIRVGYIQPGVYFRIGRTIRVSRSRLMDWLNAGGSANRAA